MEFMDLFPFSDKDVKWFKECGDHGEHGTWQLRSMGLSHPVLRLSTRGRSHLPRAVYLYDTEALCVARSIGNEDVMLSEIYWNYPLAPLVRKSLNKRCYWVATNLN